MGLGGRSRTRCRCCRSSRPGQLGGLNDSFYANDRYDELFELQQKAVDPVERKGYITEMQEIFYRDAPYHVMYYDSELHAYRTDRFAGWVNQPPESGTPLFGYGPIGYTKLTLASEAAPSASAPASGGAAPSGGAATPVPTEPAPTDPRRQHAAARGHPGARRDRGGRADPRAATARHDGHDDGGRVTERAPARPPHVSRGDRVRAVPAR